MKRNPKNFIQHLERYLFALPFCRKKRVLDLGSKEGYGSHLISHTACSISLADCNATYLRQAEKYYRFLCPATYIWTNFNDTFPEGKWDTIVAFEIIEHVDNPDNFVKEIAKHLNEEGRLIFSVPHMRENIAHKTLFNTESIVKLISKYLRLEEFYIQDSYGISGEPTHNKGYVGVATK